MKTPKTLKLSHKEAEEVRSGNRRVTWRMFDEKQLRVDDVVQLIDKVDPADPAGWVRAGDVTIDMIIEKRLGDVTDAEIHGYDDYASRDAMLAAFRQYYGQDIDWQTPVKMIYFHVDNREEKDDSSVKTTTHEAFVKLFADGGSRGNPGPSAAGYVLYTPRDEIILKRGEYLGITTNNQAEYQAVRLGLEQAKKQGVREVRVYLDSLLVVNQMRGVFKVKNRELWGVHEALKSLVEAFNKVTFTHVPRELNKVADGEVNRVLDDQQAHASQKNGV